MKDFAHCKACDKAINLDTDKWEVIQDQTYCNQCSESSYNGYIYHKNDELEKLRVGVDLALTAYLKALGYDDSDMGDMDYNEFDDAIRNLIKE